MKILFISNFIFLQRVQAMNMFQAYVRSPWIYNHCREVLKYCDKWMIIPQSNPRPRSPVYEGTHDTLVSLDSDQDPYSNATVSSPRRRPLRRKASKESRHKSKASPTDTSNSISDTIREVSGQSEKRNNFYEEQKLQLLKEQAQREDVPLDIARRAEDRMQKAQDRLQMIADDAIMEKDISHMSVEQQHYYQLRKHAIMAKAMKNASSSNFNVLPDY